MLDKTKKNIHLVCDVAMSALLIITGVLLIVSCVSVYNLGDRPFTSENISAAFNKIRIPVFITVGAIIADFILQLILPRKERKSKVTVDKRAIASRLEKKLDRTLCDKDLITLIDKEKKIRLCIWLIPILSCVSTAVICAPHLLNINNYSLDNYNESVIAVFLWMLPSLLLLIGLSIALSYLENKSLDRLIKHLKAAIAQSAKKPSCDVTQEEKANKKWAPTLILGARIVIFALAVFFIIEGISNGGASDVLIKAINICTECIGLG